MQKTKNLELPIYDNPELDVFDLEDWNLANQNIDIAYEEMANFKQDLAKVNANAEVVEARKGKTTLGDKIDEIDSFLEQKTNEINDINNNIPYENFDRKKTVEYDGKYNHYQGFQNFAKRTYGRCEQATVISAIANKDKPVPSVLWTDTKGLAKYTNRDSVTAYIENTGNGALFIIEGGLIFDTNSVTLPSSIDTSKIKIGMVLDAGKTINSTRYVGIVKDIQGQKLILEDGWWLCRNDSQESTQGTPTEQFLRVQWTNKVWVLNSNMFIDDGCPAGSNMELGVICNTSNIDNVGGIDLVNMGLPTHYGIHVRGLTNGFNDGYVSTGNGRHFVAKKGENSTSLLHGEHTNGKVFDITMDGALSKQLFKIQTLTTSGDLSPNCGIVVLNGNNVNLTLPPANEYEGRIIEIISVGTGNLLTARSGDGIAAISSQSQQISLDKTSGKTHRSARFMSNGGNLWFQLASLM